MARPSRQCGGRSRTLTSTSDWLPPTRSGTPCVANRIQPSSSSGTCSRISRPVRTSSSTNSRLSRPGPVSTALDRPRVSPLAISPSDTLIPPPVRCCSVSGPVPSSSSESCVSRGRPRTRHSKQPVDEASNTMSVSVTRFSPSVPSASRRTSWTTPRARSKKQFAVAKRSDLHSNYSHLSRGRACFVPEASWSRVSAFLNGRGPYYRLARVRRCISVWTSSRPGSASISTNRSERPTWSGALEVANRRPPRGVCAARTGAGGSSGCGPSRCGRQRPRRAVGARARAPPSRSAAAPGAFLRRRSPASS